MYKFIRSLLKPKRIFVILRVMYQPSDKELDQQVEIQEQEA